MVINNYRIKRLCKNSKKEMLDKYFSSKDIDISALKDEEIPVIVEKFIDDNSEDKGLKLAYEIAKISRLSEFEEFRDLLADFETKEEFSNFFQSLKEKTDFTNYDIAIYLALRSPKLFENCYDVLEFSKAKKDHLKSLKTEELNVKITEESIQKLEESIKTLNLSKKQCGKHCKIEHFQHKDKHFFSVDTDKGASNLSHWKAQGIKHDKVFLLREIIFVYHPLDGTTEIAVSHKQRDLNDLLRIFLRDILATDIKEVINTPYYDLTEIQSSIREGRDFTISNKKGMRISINELSFLNLSNGIELKFNASKTSKDFLYTNVINSKDYQVAIKGHHLSRVGFNVEYKDINDKKKNKNFHIKPNESDLSYDDIDSEIRNLLKEHNIIESKFKSESIKLLIKNLIEDYSINGKINIFDCIRKHKLHLKVVDMFLEGNLLNEYASEEIFYCFDCNCKTLILQDEGYLHCESCVAIHSKIDDKYLKSYSINLDKIKHTIQESFKSTKWEFSYNEGLFYSRIEYNEKLSVRIYLCSFREDIEKITIEEGVHKLVITLFANPLHKTLLVKSIQDMILDYKNSNIILDKRIITELKNANSLFSSSSTSNDEKIEKATMWFKEHNPIFITQDKKRDDIWKELTNAGFTMSDKVFRKFWKENATQEQKQKGNKKKTK